MSTPVLSVRELNIRFAQADKPSVHAVKNVSFELQRGETLALVGESGSGKSLTALSLLRLLPKQAQCTGEILLTTQQGQVKSLLTLPEEAMRSVRGARMAMVFQDPMNALNPVWTVGAQIVESLRLHRAMDRTQAERAAMALLEEVGLPDPARRFHRFAHELSGGQQQRVMIAMAIACAPEVLIADEPTTALDVTVQKRILELLRDLQRRYQMSMLFITHDLGIVQALADRVLVMRAGEAVEHGRCDEVLNAPKHPYTRALLACRPSVHVRVARLPVVEEVLAGRVASQAVTVTAIQPTEDAPVVLEARGLRKTFPVRAGWFRRTAQVAVQDVSFQLRRAHTLGIVGESGSGKTTLGWMLLRLHRACAGELWFDGQEVLKLSTRAWAPYRRRIQIVFQNPFASLNPRWTVGHILMEPLRRYGLAANRAEGMRLARQWLDRVELPASALDRYPHEFSGGQRQRIAIARALTVEPHVLVCDECVSALDVSVQAHILNLLKRLQEELGVAYVFITHDLAVVRHVADDILVMRASEAVEYRPADAVFAHPEHAYTRELLASTVGKL